MIGALIKQLPFSYRKRSSSCEFSVLVEKEREILCWTRWAVIGFRLWGLDVLHCRKMAFYFLNVANSLHHDMHTLYIYTLKYRMSFQQALLNYTCGFEVPCFLYFFQMMQFAIKFYQTLQNIIHSISSTRFPLTPRRGPLSSLILWVLPFYYVNGGGPLSSFAQVAGWNWHINVAKLNFSQVFLKIKCMTFFRSPHSSAVSPFIANWILFSSLF